MRFGLYDFGILDRDTLLAAAGSKSKGLKQEIAYPLLREFSGALTEAEDRALSALYFKLRGGERNTKRTYSGKYERVDAKIAQAILDEFPSDQAIRVHDMAVSNGATALDLFNHLQGRENLSFHATDYFDLLYQVDVPESDWTVLFDVEGKALQYINYRRNIVIRVHRSDRHYKLINRWMKSRLNRDVLPKAQAVLKDGGSRVSELPLWHPDFLNAVSENENLTCGREDLFAPETAPVEVIRIMGVFRMMSDTRHVALLNAVCKTLVQGGLLVVCMEKKRDISLLGCSAFRRVGDAMVLAKDLAEPHDISDIVLGLDLSE